MNEGSTWPEQEAVLEWLGRYTDYIMPTLPRAAPHELMVNATAYRLQVQDERDKLQDMLDRIRNLYLCEDHPDKWKDFARELGVVGDDGAVTELVDVPDSESGVR